MRFERKLVVTTKDGKTYSSNIVADNGFISVFRNGYCNWDGKRTINGFDISFTDSRGKQDTAFAVTRKEVKEEAAYRITPYGEQRGLTYKLEKL